MKVTEAHKDPSGLQHSQDRAALTSSAHGALLRKKQRGPEFRGTFPKPNSLGSDVTKVLHDQIWSPNWHKPKREDPALSK